MRGFGIREKIRCGLRFFGVFLCGFAVLGPPLRPPPVEPPVSDHPKCKDSVVALITCKNRTTGSLFQEEIRAIHFMEDNLLHTLCKLSHV